MLQSTLYPLTSLAPSPEGPPAISSEQRVVMLGADSSHAFLTINSEVGSRPRLPGEAKGAPKSAIDRLDSRLHAPPDITTDLQVLPTEPLAVHPTLDPPSSTLVRLFDFQSQ